MTNSAVINNNTNNSTTNNNYSLNNASNNYSSLNETNFYYNYSIQQQQQQQQTTLTSAYFQANGILNPRCYSLESPSTSELATNGNFFDIKVFKFKKF